MLSADVTPTSLVPSRRWRGQRQRPRLRLIQSRSSSPYGHPQRRRPGNPYHTESRRSESEKDCPWTRRDPRAGHPRYSRPVQPRFPDVEDFYHHTTEDQVCRYAGHVSLMRIDVRSVFIKVPGLPTQGPNVDESYPFPCGVELSSPVIRWCTNFLVKDSWIRLRSVFRPRKQPYSIIWEILVSILIIFKSWDISQRKFLLSRFFRFSLSSLIISL